jgi:hypothetical protein
MTNPLPSDQHHRSIESISPSPSIVVDKDERERHTKKHILLDQKKGDKTKPPI